MSATLTIVCYHRVLPADTRTGAGRPYFARGTAVSVESFERQVRELASRFEVLDEAGVVAWLAGRRSLARPACWVTFDDGYRDVLTHAAPVLERLGVPATLFVVTDALAHGRSLPADRWYATLGARTRSRGTLVGPEGEWAFDLDRAEDYARFIDGPEKRRYLRSPGPERTAILQRLARALATEPIEDVPDLYLRVDDLAALVRAGWTIGSHTKSHALLPVCTAEEQAAELCESRSYLRSLGIDAKSLAYPDGAWNEHVAEQAAAAGFELAVTLDRGLATSRSARHALPRLLPPADP